MAGFQVSTEEPQVLRAQARHSQQFALLVYGELRMLWIDPWALVFSR